MSRSWKITFPESIVPLLGTLNNASIIIACSGGSDSMVLLDICTKNHDKASIIVAHIHHGIRETAARDEKIVEKYCKENNLCYEVTHIDVKKESKRTKTTIEECARNIRKEWLEEIRRKYDAQYILTAHHADDQTETILYRLIKWTGITGLAGIQENNGYYFRPLLSVKKQEILAYAQENTIPFWHDETNDDTSIPRNLIRHSIIPEIEKINPEAWIALARLSHQAAELKNGFDEFFEKELGMYPPSPWEGGLEMGGEKKEGKSGGCENSSITFEKYHSLPKSFQHELLRYWYERANGSTHGFSSALVDELDRFLSTRNGGKKELGKAWIRKNRWSICIDN